MCAASGRTINYDCPGIWDQLAAVLRNDFAARPASRSGYVECPPGWNWRPNLRDYDLWFAVKGRGQLQLGARAYDIKSGTLMFLRPGDTGWAMQDPEDRLTVVYVHLDFVTRGGGSDALMPTHWLPSRYVPFDSVTPLEPLLVKVVRLLDSHRPLAEAEATLILQQALLEIYRQDAANHNVPVPQPDPRLERVLSHLNATPQDRMSLEQAAALAGLSAGYFSRLFTQEVGTSFRDYALHARLERSRYLLEETDMLVGQVATALGYDDVFLFSRQFRRHYGVSPTRFRDQIRNINV